MLGHLTRRALQIYIKPSLQLIPRSYAAHPDLLRPCALPCDDAVLEISRRRSGPRSLQTFESAQMVGACRLRQRSTAPFSLSLSLLVTQITRQSYSQVLSLCRRVELCLPQIATHNVTTRTTRAPKRRVALRGNPTRKVSTLLRLPPPYNLEPIRVLPSLLGIRAPLFAVEQYCATPILNNLPALKRHGGWRNHLPSRLPIRAVSHPARNSRASHPRSRMRHLWRPARDAHLPTKRSAIFARTAVKERPKAMRVRIPVGRYQMNLEVMMNGG